MVLHLEGGTRAHFMRVLAQEYPRLVEGYERLFAGKYATASYTDEVQRMVGLLKAKYRILRRGYRARVRDADALAGRSASANPNALRARPQ